MSNPEAPTTTSDRPTVIFTRYVIIADGITLFESAEWNEAYRFFLDEARFRPGVRDVQFVIKRRALPEGGKYSDIMW